MTNHVRTQLRDAVVGACDALTTTGIKCYPNRPGSRPVQTSELPLLLVYTNDENVELSSGTRGTRRLERVIELAVRGYARGTGDVDATLDTICAEVETALAADPTLGGLAKDLYLAAVKKEADDQAEQPTWFVDMTWRCEYHTREAAPTAAAA